MSSSISIEKLKLWYSRLIAREIYIGKPPAFRYKALVYDLSLCILKHFLGDKWILKFVDEGTHTDDKYYQQDQLLHMDKVIALADMLLNCQDLEGFENWKQDFLNRSDPWALGHELLAAGFFLRHGIVCKLKEATGKMGTSYDLEVVLDGQQVACEVKAKSESTTFSENTIDKVVKKAIQQIPKDEPNIVFLSVPQEWMADERLQERTFGIIEKRLKYHKRPSMLILHFEDTEISDVSEESSNPSISHIQQILLPRFNNDATFPIEEEINASVTNSKYNSLHSLTSSWHDDREGLPVITGNLAS